MDFDWSPEELTFRDEVREFIAENLTDEVQGSIFIDTPERVAFVDKMADRGWLGMGFPEKYGGSKKPIPLAQFILTVELDLAGAPIVGKNVGVVANTILNECSEEMKQEFLPKIFKNQGQWALTYTEACAGTDIGAMQCPAVDKGDYFEVTGTKLFITSAHFAKYHWIALRTDPDAPKHKGISIFIMDADSPGISLTPMHCIGTTGTTHRTNEVFLDHVKIPRSRLVGELNKGFYYMMQALDYERFAILSFASRVRRFGKIVDWVKQADYNGNDRPIEDPVIRRKLARMATRVEVGTMLERLCICAAMERVPAVEAAMNKAWGAEVGAEMGELALDIMGPFGYLWAGAEHAPLNGYLVDEHLMAGHARVAAAGVDTAKSIIARRLLGLPNALGKPVVPGKN
ncbi:MAG: acyl-CoA dehydrogenase family protein [Deltaproteobacteria bacterium]|nr:acyl-CoA dehydrogenase family protein [Deltaproteobacteria bacterium]MBW2390198.1 acyl-CoA dehydrogenase family protein [Deltaproteobacteria bacterium]